MKIAVLVAVVGLGALQSSSALLFWNLDNSANQTDPGSGVPFASVGRVTNTGGIAGSGSAVYLGDGYILTANHVTVDSTFRYVTFNGTDSYEVDTSFVSGGRYAGKPVAAGVDMAVVRLLSSPTVTPVSLMTSPLELIAPATVVGWGRGRDPSVALSSTSVAWGEAATEAKRWGINVPRGLTSISYGSGSFSALVTILGSSSGSPAGVGDSEAALTLNDSGSGLFQLISGNWYLIGVGTNVEVLGTSTFGNDTTFSPRGNINAYARVSTYSGTILAMIPEPSTVWLVAVAMGILFGKRSSVRRTLHVKR